MSLSVLYLPYTTNSLWYLYVYFLSHILLIGSGCGVFLKKGAKILAFFIGAAFVFLQYMRSQGLIVVKWDNISRRYNASLKRKVGDNSTSDGVAVARVWNRLVE